jgi:DNA polymerase/3'-5' exonuclease PolX
MDHAQALQLAIGLRLALEPGCERISVAGSVRRLKPEPHDLELVAIPKIEEREARDLFGGQVGVHRVDVFEIALADLLARGEWKFDPILKRNGPKYKRLREERTGICADIFLTTPAGWGGALAIRTGPAGFSQALVTLALRQRKHVADGYLIHGHMKSETGCPKGSSCSLIIPTFDEVAFFGALGLPWCEPRDRTAEWLWAEAKKMSIEGGRDARRSD